MPPTSRVCGAPIRDDIHPAIKLPKGAVPPAQGCNEGDHVIVQVNVAVTSEVLLAFEVTLTLML